MLLELADPGSLFYVIGSFEAIKCLSCVFQLQIHSLLQCHLKWNLGGTQHDERIK